MDDFTSSLLSTIEAYRLPDLDLDEAFIHPSYNGQSILNIPSSICKLLDTPLLETPPLIPEILSPLDDGVRNAILIVVDALAFYRLQKWMDEDKNLVWDELANDGLFAPITSTAPSTTSSAITTLWTGASPARHGIMGYEMWLKEYGVVANMIEYTPITYRRGEGSLVGAGFEPETFLPVGSIAEHLKRHGVPAHVFQHFSIINSGLTRMFNREAHLHPFSTISDLWISLRQLMENLLDQRNYIWVYWGAIDGLSHLYGPDSERPRAEFKLFSAAFEQLFLENLTPAARKDSLIILTADHGQTTTDNTNDHYNLNTHPDFMRMLHMKPSGESRFTYLYIRPGQTEAVRDYIEIAWPGEFLLIEPETAVEKGLFGPGTPHKQLADRIGDLIVTARGDAYWWWAKKDNPLKGRHGGLSHEDMIVPFLAARL